MKKNTALYILAVIICLFLAAFVFHVPALRHLFHNLYGILQSPYILVSAAVCAFLFINTKNYWLTFQQQGKIDNTQTGLCPGFFTLPIEKTRIIRGNTPLDKHIFVA